MLQPCSERAGQNATATEAPTGVAAFPRHRTNTTLTPTPTNAGHHALAPPLDAPYIVIMFEVNCAASSSVQFSPELVFFLFFEVRGGEILKA
jgi:hypothetical protein